MLNSGTILVIDDNDANRYFFTYHLTKAGYHVIEASSGLEGIELAKNDPDLIILDVNLPDISGFEVCARLKNSIYKRIPIIHTSASLTEATNHYEGIESGADGYITTPIDPLILLGTIKTWIRVRKTDKEHHDNVDKLHEERDMREKFVSTLSHDLRTPLSAAKLGTTLLARKLSHDQGMQTIMNRIILNIERTDNMIRDLLDANMLKAGESLPLRLEVSSIQAIVVDTVNSLMNIFGDVFKVSVEDIVGEWDSEAIRRIIENLASNAVKYGDQIHKINIRAYPSQDNKLLILEVHNFGNVIPVENLNLLFDSYKRSANPNAQKGWGLGLSLVKGLAEAHNGNVHIESNEEDGTTFIVQLPTNLKDKA